MAEDPAGEEAALELLEALADARDDGKPVADQLIGRTWAELEVLEHAGHLLFPGELHRRQASGEFKAEPVRLRVLREPDLRKARALARKVMAEDGLDPKLDPQMLEDLTVVCQLSIAVRDATPPHSPFEEDPRKLEGRYDRDSLRVLSARLDVLSRLLDPKAGDITKEEFLAVTAAMVKERSIRPLLAFDSASQEHYVITTAALLMSSPAFRSLWDSCARSTLEPSTSPS